MMVEIRENLFPYSNSLRRIRQRERGEALYRIREIRYDRRRNGKPRYGPEAGKQVLG